LEVDYLVTWNLTHIMNKDLVPLFNRVNKKMGFKPIKVIRPEEFVSWINQLN
jgi:hypothetical protein